MEPCRVLSRQAARRFYDHLGAGQDTQIFYERPAIAAMVAHMNFCSARAIVEFGCGTGRFAVELLQRHLRPDARYLGLDISATMVGLTRKRIARFGPRAQVCQTEGDPRIPAGDLQFDRFVSSYVLDLLSEDDRRAVFGEAHRVLAPTGLMGLVSLTYGARGLARIISWTWERVHRISPMLVGGCHPINLLPLLQEATWTLRHNSVVTAFGVASQVVVAERPNNAKIISLSYE